MKQIIRYYLAIFLRRIHYFLIIFGIVTLASVTLSRILPSAYVSQAKLLIESAQIPDSLAQATVQTGPAEQMQIVEQRLLTRANLLDLSRKLNVFADSGNLAVDDIISKMRASTKISRRSGRGQANMMTISFEAEKGTTAAGVVNEYVTMIMRDNIELRTERAGDTLEFFEQEVSRLEGELSEQSAIILVFKNSASDALPSSLGYRLSQQSRLQERLTTVEREVATLIEQKRRLIQIFEATGQVGPIAQSQLTPEQKQLAKLEDELDSALVIFAPSNPKIKILEARIARMRTVVVKQSGSDAINAVTPTSLLDIQVAEMDARTGLLKEQAEDITQELVVIKDGIDRTPANSIKLSSLERDYANSQKQYNTAVDRLAKAATGERIELLSKGQRISIIEAATVPSRPNKPNRSLIAIGGTIAGVVLGLAFVVVLEILSGSVRRSADITKKLGVTPIATIPYVRTPVELVMRRAVLFSIFAIIVVGLPALIFAIHTYYLPLDLIFDRIASKFGSII